MDVQRGLRRLHRATTLKSKLYIKYLKVQT